MTSRKKLLVVSDLLVPGLPFTGGTLRSTRSIKEYSRHYKVYLITPDPVAYRKAAASPQLVQELTISRLLAFEARFRFLEPVYLRYDYILYASLPAQLFNWITRAENPSEPPDAVIVLNESVRHLTLGAMFKERYGVPSMAVFQLPLFYADRERREQISRAFKAWYRELYDDSWLGRSVREVLRTLELAARSSRKVRKLCEKQDVFVAVSRSIPVEMGEEWLGRFKVLDPGVGLDDEDVELIKRIRSSTRGKGDHVVFGGRPDPLKGFIEGLYAFQELANRYPSLRLVVTGHVGPRLKPRIKRFLKRLGLSEKVILTGAIPRAERFKLVAESRFMLYPSHIDGFPYAVIEALHLGTPVVGYDIPSLRMYYSGNPGVKLVREGDVEALVAESLNIVESKNVEVEAPELKPWSDVIFEELSIVRSLLGNSEPLYS